MDPRASFGRQAVLRPEERAPERDDEAEPQAEPTRAQEYAPGELAPAIVTPKKKWKPEDFEDKSLVETILELFRTCTGTDEAARRWSVLETWQNRHMDRGYQYLESSSAGGWSIAGAGAVRNKNGIAETDDAGLYPTNVLSAQGDIAVGALCRGRIKVSFAPRRSKDPQCAASADDANQYVHLWEKNNPGLQRDVMNAGWTESRIVTWTRSVADKSRFGSNDDGSPRVVEVTTAHGVLESKLPMMADELEQCGYAQIFEEVDYALARAEMPWMGDKIKPSWGTAGELEFERIARINTRIGITGKYMTGTSGIREATLGHGWFRPGMYFDDKITPAQRDFLLREFPSGIHIVVAGQDFCCCWDESMDDHVALGMYTRGFGQNRRSLGSSDVPIQKRINIWADLWDKFIRKAIPFTALHSDAWNPEAINQLESTPGRNVPVTPPEGMSIQETFGQSPEAQPIAGMMEMFQWYVGPLMQAIDGATPALNGSAEAGGDQGFVGTTQIRLQQSLERFGPAWIMANRLFAKAATQAALCCGENQSAEIYDSVPGRGDVRVNPANLKSGLQAVAETINSIPESGAQREAKVMQILDMAQANPQVASIVATPSNTREIVKALHIDDVITVDEANSEDLALENIEALLEAEPLLNPAWQKLADTMEQKNTQHEAAKAAAVQGLAAGTPPPPEAVAAGAAMKQELAQLQQQLQQVPKYLPSVSVAEDQSQDNATIASTVFAWMQEPDGRALRKAAAREPEGGAHWKQWTNVFLYWQGNRQTADKLQQAQAQSQFKAPPPKVNITGKLTPEQQAQLLQLQAGIQTSAQELAQPHEVERETRVYTPQSEVTTKVKRKRL